MVAVSSRLAAFSLGFPGIRFFLIKSAQEAERRGLVHEAERRGLVHEAEPTPCFRKVAMAR